MHVKTAMHVRTVMHVMMVIKYFLRKVHEYCGTVFPERFFDILYKNEEISFSSNSEANTMFYPNVDFRELWQRRNQ